jgi:hypothetical protein
MRRVLSAAIVAICLTWAVQDAHALTVGGIPVDGRATVGETTLVLNGAGVREKFFFDIYVAALYLPTPTRDAAQAIGMRGPKHLAQFFLYKEVARAKIVEGWRDGFRNNLTGAEHAALLPRIEAFCAMFTRAFKRGETVTFDFVPGAGVTVYINGDEKGTIEGDDFSAALLKIWLGPDPASGSLKRALLGG